MLNIFLDGAFTAAEKLVDHPGKFIRTVAEGTVDAFNQYLSYFPQSFLQDVWDWLVGGPDGVPLGGIKPPQSLSAGEIIRFVLQIAGFNTATLEKLMGEEGEPGLGDLEIGGISVRAALEDPSKIPDPIEAYIQEAGDDFDLEDEAKKFGEELVLEIATQVALAVTSRPIASLTGVGAFGVLFKFLFDLIRKIGDYLKRAIAIMKAIGKGLEAAAFGSATPAEASMADGRFLRFRPLCR